VGGVSLDRKGVYAVVMCVVLERAACSDEAADSEGMQRWSCCQAVAAGCLGAPAAD
jgi:hypothetical protein